MNGKRDSFDNESRSHSVEIDLISPMTHKWLINASHDDLVGLITYLVVHDIKAATVFYRYVKERVDNDNRNSD